MRIVIRGTWSCQVFAMPTSCNPGFSKGTLKEPFRCEVEIGEDGSVTGMFFRGDEKEGSRMIGFTAHYGEGRSILMTPEPDRPTGESDLLEISVIFRLREDAEGRWSVESPTITLPTLATLTLNGAFDCEVRIA